MSKRLRDVKKHVQSTKHHAVDDAVAFFINDYTQKYSANFDETIELVVKLGIDTKQSNQVVKGSVSLPNTLGKVKKVAAIVDNLRIQDAKRAGADFVGGEDLIKKIKEGFTDFEVCIATPNMMSKINAIAKILGPKGLMPDVKTGTISDDIAVAIEKNKKGQLLFKVDKSGIVHAGIAKISFAASKIKENIMSLYDTIILAKPTKLRGIYIRKSFLTCTHGPSLKLDLRSFSGYSAT